MNPSTGDLWAGARACRSRLFGVTIVELMIVITIIGLLSFIGLPAYQDHIKRGRNAVAIADIRAIEVSINRNRILTGQLPDSLAEIGRDSLIDPWGNGYRYQRIEGANLKGKGKVRKDKALVPVNSDYDLYSMGPDGDSKMPFTAKASRDDIVRCNNGEFVGIADEY